MNAPSNTGRIWLVFVGLTVIGLMVFGRILMIQTVEHETWASRGEEFSTSVRTIEPARGQIVSRDGSLLATSVPVYDLRWDAKCEGMRWDMYDAQIDTLCIALGSAIGKSPSSLKAKFDNARNRGHRGALIGRNIPFTSYQELRELPFVKLGRYKSGLVFERRENRRRPFGKLAARTVGIDREHQRVGIERAWNDELAGVEGQQLSRRVAGNQWMPVTDEYLVIRRAGRRDHVGPPSARRGHQRPRAAPQARRRGTVIGEVQTGHIGISTSPATNPPTAQSSTGRISTTPSARRWNPAPPSSWPPFWPAWKKACCPRIPWTPNKAKSTSTESACATAITRMEATEKSTC